MAGTGHHETAVSSKLSCGIRSLHGGGTADAAVQDDGDRPCRAVLDQIVDIPELDGTRPQMCDRGVARAQAQPVPKVEKAVPAAMSSHTIAASSWPSRSVAVRSSSICWSAREAMPTEALAEPR